MSTQKQWSHYSDEEDVRHFYDYFKLKTAQYRTPKHFNKKLYAVEMCGDYANELTPKISIVVRFIMSVINILIYPLKYIPTKSVFKADILSYKTITFRIGDVINGYSVEFHIPKKFSFKNNK